MNNRQIRLIGICALAFLLVLYYISHGARNTRESAFYRNTVSVLTINQGQSSGGGGGASGGIDLDDPIEIEKIENYKKAMRELALEFDPAGEDGARADVYLREKERLKSESAAAAAATDPPTAFGVPPTGEEPLFPEIVEPAIPPPAAEAAEDYAVGAEKSVAGRKKMKDDKLIPKPASGAKEGEAKIGNVGSSAPHGNGDKQTSETDEADKIEAELNAILKRSPIVIFSKSYCPYSKKAKHILQDLYSISPAPHVVELDQHEMGAGLQSTLHSLTGRRTVPNVLINGKSIGGGDDIERLHLSGELIETVQSEAGKDVVSIKATPPAPPAGGKQAGGAAQHGQGKVQV